MIGAIIGDIAGSSYEAIEATSEVSYEQRIKILDKNVSLFNKDSEYTDDTVLTIALIDALLNDRDYEKYIKEYTKKESNLGIAKYGRSRFGQNFIKWVYQEEQGTSYGNGSAMRISPIGYYFDNIEDVIKETTRATICSHNHEDSITGAIAVASAIYYAKKGYTKADIQREMSKYYNLDYNLENLQRNNKFTSKTKDTVPQAIYIFLISNDFEDAIRKSISIGGDTDTIAAMAGSIAEAYYGVPKELQEQALSYLKKEYINNLNAFYEKDKTKKR